MENLKEHIDERLWNFIKSNYNSENYTNAILYSIQFIGDLIREKSGLESDGNTLVGSAFGGNNPKIKLNKLKTESDRNIQKGIESILRGIYSAFRNPRSHSKYEDSESESDEIILFINHLLKLIDKSKGKFTVDTFLERVFDEDFVQSKQYSDLIVKDIPIGKTFEVAVEIFRKKENGNINNLRYVWFSIYDKLTEAERKEIIDMASEELRFTDFFDTIIRCIALFENSWKEIDEDARLRSENKLIKAISSSELSDNGRISKFGYYASWLTSVVESSLLKGEIADALYEALKSGKKDRQRFVIKYFGGYIEDLESELFLESLTEILKAELNKGNKVIFDFVTGYELSDNRKAELKESIDSFEESEDLPF